MPDFMSQKPVRPESSGRGMRYLVKHGRVRRNRHAWPMRGR
jgi:hypothetical protein